MAKQQSTIVPGGIPEYISKSPKEAQAALKSVRAAIRSIAPDATETMSYFEMPGYYCTGDYAYNGMFVWFSYKAPYVRVHVLPSVIKKHKKELAAHLTTAAIVSFPSDRKVPIALVKRLVKESLKAMKKKPKK